MKNFSSFAKFITDKNNPSSAMIPESRAQFFMRKRAEVKSPPTVFRIHIISENNATTVIVPKRNCGKSTEPAKNVVRDLYEPWNKLYLG